MASVIRRVRRTRVKLEHGYDVHHWWLHGSQHPGAARHRAAWRRGPFAPPSVPSVVDRLTRVHEKLDRIKADAFDAPQPARVLNAEELAAFYPR